MTCVLVLLAHAAEAKRPKSVLAGRGFSGAIFTTDSTCTVVDGNIYGSKMDVYLTGGGRGVRLPEGSYYVQVTEPNGTQLGSSGAAAPIQVIDGKFADCYQLWALVGGFGDSRNGEYKVWVCRDAGYVSCKTDNFRIRPARIATATRTPTPTQTAAGIPTATVTSTPLTPGPGEFPTSTATVTRTSTVTATRTATPTSTRTSTQTPVSATATPTFTVTLTLTNTPVTPTATLTSTPITAIPGIAPTSTPTPSPTATPPPGVATATPTFGFGPGVPGAQIPTLSPGMLLLLAAALGAFGFLFARRG